GRLSEQSSSALYKRLLSYLRPYAKTFGLGVVGMVAAAATEPLFPALIKPLLDAGFGTKVPSTPPLLFAGAIIAIFLVRGILTFTSAYLMSWVSSRVILDLRAATFVLTVLVRDSIAVVGLFACLFYLSWKLTLIAVLIAPPIGLIVRTIASRLRKMARGAQRTMGDLVHVLQETIECHKVVKVFGGEAYEAKRFLRTAQMLRGFLMREQIAASLTTPITHVLAATAVAVIIYIAMQDTVGTRATVGEFASFMTAMMMLLAPIKHLTELNPHIQRGLAASESVFGLIDTPAEEDTGHTMILRARGEVAFEGVHFTYPTRVEPALAGIDLRIRPGETLALAGPSGGGKTTLVNLLPRFYT